MDSVRLFLPRTRDMTCEWKKAKRISRERWTPSGCSYPGHATWPVNEKRQREFLERDGLRQAVPSQDTLHDLWMKKGKENFWREMGFVRLFLARTRYMTCEWKKAKRISGERWTPSGCSYSRHATWPVNEKRQREFLERGGLRQAVPTQDTLHDLWMKKGKENFWREMDSVRLLLLKARYMTCEWKKAKRISGERWASSGCS